jgi:hypothetical protein
MTSDAIHRDLQEPGDWLAERVIGSDGKFHPAVRGRGRASD